MDMQTTQKTERSRGIVYDADAGIYRTDWGTVKMNVTTGLVEVRGPSPEKWLDLDAALKTAALFAGECPNVGMALAIAIHMQFAAWKGALSLGHAGY
jgi:hypothetical protein